MSKPETLLAIYDHLRQAHDCSAGVHPQLAAIIEMAVLETVRLMSGAEAGARAQAAIAATSEGLRR